MRSCSLSKLWAVGAAAVIVMAAIASSNAPASAQTMGEYATTLGQSASFGESIAPSLPPPAADSNPVGGANSTTTIEVTGDDRDGPDGSKERVPRDARDNDSGSSPDDWSAVR